MQLTNTSGNSTPVETLNYQRDDVGNITQITDSVSSETTDYVYDALYRLNNVNSTTNAEDRSYTYDRVGNRKTELTNGTTYYYCYHTSNCSAAPNGNRLINIRTGSLTGPLYRQFSYDNSGRLLQKQDGSGVIMYSVTYNGKGRANQINTSSFAYDANDYRINKNSDRYYLEGEHIEATYSSSDQLQNKYFRGVIVDEIVNGFTYHSSNANDWSNYTYHHDHLNSVTHLTGHNGSSEESTAYDAFGAPLNLSVPGTGNDLLYTGREYDRDTSLYYYRARYYDPEIGRFISEDPLGFEAGINFYAYVNNNPINLNDPSGNCPSCVGAVVNVIAGAGVRLLTNQNITLSNVLIDAAAGATGAGIVSNFGRLSTLARASSTAGVNGLTFTGTEIANNAVDISRGSNISLTKGVTFGSVVTGSLLGLPTGNIGSRIADNAPAITANAFEQAAVEIGFQSSVDTGVGLLQRPVSSFIDSNTPDLSFPATGFSTPAVTFGSQLAGRPSSSSAGGGFVLYPNRPNTNMIQSVYAK